MTFHLLPASPEHKAVIENLFQFYIYDFSEFIPLQVGSNGLFPAYPFYEEYWQGNRNRIPYIIQEEDTYAGFAFVKFYESISCYSMAEFFILKGYRRKGLGKKVAMQLFNLHKGPWEVQQRETNTQAQQFWVRVITEYTNGHFTERFEDGRRIQIFDSV